MKISGFAPYGKRAHLKKCLKKAPALNLKFRPNRLQPAAGRYNCIFAISPPTRIAAIQRNTVEIDENLDSDRIQLCSFLWQT